MTPSYLISLDRFLPVYITVSPWSSILKSVAPVLFARGRGSSPDGITTIDPGGIRLALSRPTYVKPLALSRP